VPRPQRWCTAKANVCRLSAFCITSAYLWCLRCRYCDLPNAARTRQGAMPKNKAMPFSYPTRHAEYKVVRVEGEPGPRASRSDVSRGCKFGEGRRRGVLSAFAAVPALELLRCLAFPAHEAMAAGLLKWVAGGRSVPASRQGVDATAPRPLARRDSTIGSLEPLSLMV
jgi:hypothetical protein